MVWYFIGVYIIKRTLHGRVEIRNFSARVEKIFHSFATLTREIFFNTRREIRISARPRNILYLSCSMYLYGCTNSPPIAHSPNTPQFQAVDSQQLCHKGSLSSDVLSNARQQDQKFVENHGSRVQQVFRLTLVAQKHRCLSFLIKAELDLLLCSGTMTVFGGN